jgi:hypothetical protein
MLNVKLLNDQAELNYYFNITSVSYIPGETVKINIQFFDVDSGVRFIPSTSATCTAQFKQNDGTMLTKTASMLFNPDDRSIWQISLSTAESQVIVGSNFLVLLDVLGDSTNVQQAMGVNMLSPVYFDGDC